MAVLKVPFCVASLWRTEEPDHVIRSGEALINATAQLGSDDRASTCQFTFYDPGLAIAAQYRQLSIEKGGLQVPENVLAALDEAVPQAEDGTGAAVLPSRPVDSFRDRDTLDDAGETGGRGGGSSEAISIPNGLRGDALAAVIVQYCQSRGMTNLREIAAILGTCEKESAMGVYLYEIGKGGGRHGIYYGRGLVQLTWKENYQRMSGIYGIDLVANPDRVSDLDLAVPILVDGMISGYFTAYRLNNFANIQDNYTYFWETRKIVNPGELTYFPDRARQYVQMCQAWYTKLLGGSFTELTGSDQPSPGAPGTVITTGYYTADALPVGSERLAATGPIIQTATLQIPVSKVPAGAVEIQVEMGWNDSDRSITMAFWMVQISSDVQDQTTTITGQSPRYAMAQSDRQTQTIQNISLRMFAKRLGDIYGVTMVIPDNAAVDEIRTVYQKQENDYEVLLRMAAAMGLTVREEGDNITLESVKGGKVITVDRAYGMVLDSVSDRADRKRAAGEALPSILDVPDGKSIGEGYPTRLSIPYPSIDAMLLRPGEILSLTDEVAPSGLDVQYKVKSVSWSYQGGGIRGTVQAYIPVAIKPEQTKPADDIDRGYVPSLDGFDTYLAIAATGRYVDGTRTVDGDGAGKLAHLQLTIVTPEGQTAYDAISGAIGRQDLKRMFQSGSFAPCPPGTYAIGPGIDAGAGREAIRNGGQWWITVNSVQGRGGIGIHVDAGPTGTAGCFGLLNADDMQAVYEAFRSQGITRLIVDYSRWPQDLGRAQQ